MNEYDLWRHDKKGYRSSRSQHGLVGIERLFNGKFRQFISHASTSRRNALSQHTDTIMVLTIFTPAYCLVLKAIKYRDMMGARV